MHCPRNDTQKTRRQFVKNWSLMAREVIRETFILSVKFKWNSNHKSQNFLTKKHFWFKGLWEMGFHLLSCFWKHDDPASEATGWIFMQHQLCLEENILKQEKNAKFAWAFKINPKIESIECLYRRWPCFFLGYKFSLYSYKGVLG